MSQDRLNLYPASSSTVSPSSTAQPAQFASGPLRIHFSAQVAVQEVRTAMKYPECAGGGK
jgi:hypothetical protein